MKSLEISCFFLLIVEHRLEHENKKKSNLNSSTYLSSVNKINLPKKISLVIVQFEFNSLTCSIMVTFVLSCAFINKINIFFLFFYFILSD